jgi:hypothetical protein
MTINTWFMFLALAVGAGTSQPVEPPSTHTESLTRTGKIESNCYINGVWYNPCPSDPTPQPENPEPDPGPQILLPD